MIRSFFMNENEIHLPASILHFMFLYVAANVHVVLLQHRNHLSFIIVLIKEPSKALSKRPIMINRF